MRGLRSIGAGIVGACRPLMRFSTRGTRSLSSIPAASRVGPRDGNAGWIAHTDIMPLASPKVWRNLPRWLMDPLGPLAIRPGYLPAIAPWLARFVLASRPGTDRAQHRGHPRPQRAGAARLARRLRSLWTSRHHLRERGILSVWSSEAAFSAAAP